MPQFIIKGPLADVSGLQSWIKATFRFAYLTTKDLLASQLKYIFVINCCILNKLKEDANKIWYRAFNEKQILNKNAQIPIFKHAFKMSNCKTTKTDTFTGR